MSGNVPSPQERNPIVLAQAIRELFEGRSNAVGRVSLAVAPATTTIVDAVNCGEDSLPLLVPLDANAAAAVAAGNVYVSAIGQGTFTITHPSSAGAREFGYACLG